MPKPSNACWRDRSDHHRIVFQGSLQLPEPRRMPRLAQRLGLDLQDAFAGIPVLDRGTLTGIAAFDGRVTGETLGHDELGLVFYLLEQLGLAIRNSWLHDELAANHEMMKGILRELTIACVVVRRDLTIIHANKIARGYFIKAGNRGRELEFNDLPQELGAKSIRY